MHVLPVLSRVEEIFSSDPVQVIGVHCAKFPSERDPDNVRSAVRRHQVKHPVVVDSQHQVWDRFAVRAWPTLVLVDAAGYVRETISGEVEEEVLSERVRALLEEGRKNGTLLQGPPGLAPESEAAGSYLRFPGKLHLFQDRLFVADSGHQRIVVSNLQGEVETVVGTGESGLGTAPRLQPLSPIPRDSLWPGDVFTSPTPAITCCAASISPVGKSGRSPARGRKERSLGGLILPAPARLPCAHPGACMPLVLRS
jgi:hypothetical protein